MEHLTATGERLLGALALLGELRERGATR